MSSRFLVQVLADGMRCRRVTPDETQRCLNSCRIALVGILCICVRFVGFVIGCGWCGFQSICIHVYPLSKYAYQVLSASSHRDSPDMWRIITSLLRQNDVATSFWRNNDVIITSCVRWGRMLLYTPGSCRFIVWQFLEVFLCCHIYLQNNNT